MLGDPTPDLSVALATAAVENGAGMIEIGFPYGDPVADGPAVQRADMRALDGGTSTNEAFAILTRIHEACPDTPLNLLVYANLVHARGYERFCADAAEAGAASLLVPDMCLEESAPLKKASRQAGIGHVQLVGPLTTPERLKRIDAAANSFIYLVAHQGVTGVRDSGFDSVASLVERTAESLKNPLCVGFGLSKREQIERVFEAGARLAVVGSYLANVIGEAVARGDSDEPLITSFTEAFAPLVNGS